jgi:hypothetical protein
MWLSICPRTSAAGLVRALNNPDAARLGISGSLAKTLTSSNPIESMISIARATNRNVTHRRDGQMVPRWIAAGVLNAQPSFRWVKGYKQMPQLVATLRRRAHPNPAHGPETVSTAAYIRWDRHRNSTSPVTPSMYQPPRQGHQAPPGL